MSGAVPQLRFPGLAGDWTPVSMGEALERASDPVEVDPTETYREIGVRSHGRGLFHKEPLLGEELGNKRVFRVVPNALVLNIVFAWEQAVAMTSEDELGFIASHRFPMFLANDAKAYLPFIMRFLLTKRGKELLELASPGGAGRNKTLGQQEFLKLKAPMPKPAEQQKIADFLGTVDAKIDALRRKKSGLEAFKSGLMQSLFSQTIRFTRDDGTDFPDWEPKTLGDLFGNRIEKDTGGLPIFSVTQASGMVPRAELDRDFGGDEEATGYRKAVVGDLVYNTMRMWQGAVGIAPASCSVSPAYVILAPRDAAVPEFFVQWLREPVMVQRLKSQSYGLTEDRLRLYYNDFARIDLAVPHPDEQRKIADVLSALDARSTVLADQITQMEAFKKGLLQQMFV